MKVKLIAKNLFSLTFPGLICLGTIVNPVYAGSFRTLFVEDFESNISQWTGKFRIGNITWHDGVIVSDPLDKTNQVLSFTDRNSGGDIFSRHYFQSPTGVFRLSFDYLGLATPNSCINDLGGFVGYRTPESSFANVWLTGTSTHSFGLSPDFINLPDTGQWESISFQFTTHEPIAITFEDYIASGGVAGDVYFDNIHLEAMNPKTSVPDPSLIPSVLIVGLWGFMKVKRKEK